MSRKIRLREIIRRGCCRAAKSFISPWLPKCLLSVKVSHTRAVAAVTPNRMQVHWSMPAIYITTKRTNTASRPPTKRKRYCARSPLNSTSRPTPLLISNCPIDSCCFIHSVRGRRNAGWSPRQSGRCRHRTNCLPFSKCRDRHSKTSDTP